MKVTRAILSGVIIWTLIFLVFTVMSFIPVVKDSEVQQNMLLWIVLIPITLLVVIFFYKKETTMNGLILGLIMTGVSLVLDAFITLPFIIVPKGGSYSDFYASSFLWITIFEVVLISYVYWNTQIKNNNNNITNRIQQ